MVTDGEVGGLWKKVCEDPENIQAARKSCST